MKEIWFIGGVTLAKKVESVWKGPKVIIEVKSDSVYIAKSRREQKVMHHDKSRKLQKWLVDFQAAKDWVTSNLSKSSKNNGNLKGRPTKLRFLSVQLGVLEVKLKRSLPLSPVTNSQQMRERLGGIIVFVNWSTLKEFRCSVTSPGPVPSWVCGHNS